MILRPNRQPLVGGIEAGAFRNRPAQQYAVEFEPEIIMKTRSVVFLNKVGKLALPGLDPAWRRFGCLLKSRLRRYSSSAISVCFPTGP